MFKWWCQYSSWFGRLEADQHVCKLQLLGTAPHLSTLRLSDVITCDEISQAFPLRSCLLQRG